MLKLNSKFTVKTPNGFEKFHGVQRIYKPYYHLIIFEDGTEIKCSENHSFGSEQIRACEISVDDIIQNKKVVYNEVVEEGIYLYDLLDVGKDNLYYSNNLISHNCEFLGSVDTLISGAKLATLIQESPIKSSAGLDVYAEPNDDKAYIITVDVARGVEKDYSAFVVFDISEPPYRIVAKYRNNDIKPIMFPYVIRDTSKAYNNAYILCEINDVGDQVANALHYELECPNVLMCYQKGRAHGQTLGQGFSGKKVQMGVKMSTTVKKIGCINLKAYIEEEKLLVHDYDIIQELTTFIQKAASFAAEDGANDDLTMCLVIFAWAAAQDYFKEMTNHDLRKKIYEDQQAQMEQDMSPFGFILDGSAKEEEGFVESDGTVWHTDEYGDISHLWTSYSF